jgi:hypothetical protein
LVAWIPELQDSVDEILAHVLDADNFSPAEGVLSFVSHSNSQADKVNQAIDATMFDSVSACRCLWLQARCLPVTLSGAAHEGHVGFLEALLKDTGFLRTGSHTGEVMSLL